MSKQFLSTTIGREVKLNQYPQSKLIRFNFNKNESNGIEMIVVSGRSLGHIKKVPTVFLTQQEYDNRNVDYYDDQIEFEWCLNRIGIFYDEEENLE